MSVGLRGLAAALAVVAFAAASTVVTYRTAWYAPDVKFFVKLRSEWSGGRTAHVGTELVEYELKK